MIHKKIQSEGLDLDYYSNFLGSSESRKLFEQLENEITYLTGDLAKIKVWGKWYDLPRQQAAFGDSGLMYCFSGLSVPANAWPECLNDIRNYIENLFGYKYNFVLINRYRNGNDHIGEHRDDENMLNKNLPIASVSLGQARDFVLRHKNSNETNQSRIKINLENGSLLMMNPPTNVYWYHSLPVRKRVTGVRINLTFRSILQ